MTVPVSTRRAGPFTGNDVATSWPFEFKVFAKADIQVILATDGVETVLTLDSDYTVTLNPDQDVSPGGTISYPISGSPIASDTTVSVIGALEYDQPTDLPSGGNFSPAALEAALDYLSIQIQQLREVTERQLGLAPSTPDGVRGVLPPPQANRFLAWNADGTRLRNADASGSVDDVLVQLASSDPGEGADLVGYRGRTVDDRLRDRESIEDVGLRTTNTGAANLAALNAALPSVRELAVPLGEYPISAAPTNPLGVQFTGGGKLLKPVTNGTQQLNLTADDRRMTFGQEYMYSLHNKFRGRVGVVGVCSGDSTTFGTNITDPSALIHTLIRDYVVDRGFYMQTVNAGHGGATTAQWVSNGWLAADLALNPDVYIVRWGINDPGWKKDGTAGTLDAWESERALRRDASDFITSLRSGLATARAARDVSQMAIIVMTPNSVSDSPNGRDEKWFEAIIPGIKKACRDYQCAFIDTYSLFADSRPAAGRWMDDAFADGRAIHPLEPMNRIIATQIVDMMVPAQLGLTHVPSSVLSPAITVLPNLYGYGISTWRVDWTINGQLINGTLVNYRSADSYAMQVVYPNGFNTVRPCVRVANTDQTAWLEWIGAPIRTLSLSNSWVNDSRALAYEKSDGRVYMTGRIKSGTTTAGTVIATLPTGYRPLADACLVCACGAGLTQLATLQVNTAGQLVVLSVPSNASLDLSGASFTTY